MRFCAIDFETATSEQHSACAVAIVTVEDGKILDEFYSLIQPPDNYYWRRFTQEIHGISWRDTLHGPTFPEIFPEMEKRLKNQILVAHNARFDRGVLQATMAHHGLNYTALHLAGWECTCEIYRAKGYKPADLASCSERLNISLNHHQALSDAQACAQLFCLHQEGNIR